MDRSVHKTTLFCALRRAASRRGQRRGECLFDATHPLWLGNWLTYMNQATAFFDAAKGKVDPYGRWNANGTYKLPDLVRSNAETCELLSE